MSLVELVRLAISRLGTSHATAIGDPRATRGGPRTGNASWRPCGASARARGTARCHPGRARCPTNHGQPSGAAAACHARPWPLARRKKKP